MIICDTNLLAELWLPGHNNETAIQVLNIDSDWIAPPLWISEYRNVIAKYLRADLIDLEYAHAAMLEALEFMAHRVFDMNSYRIIDLIGSSRVSAYDAEYVALAQETGNRLVTFDKKLIDLFPDVAIHPEDFLDAASS